MSIRVRVCALLTGIVCALGALGHQALAAEDIRPPRAEDIRLSDIAVHMPALTLTPQARELRIPFTIAPGAVPSGVELTLSASPLAENANGQIEVFVNRSRAVALAPDPVAFEARFVLHADTLRAGENILVLRLSEAARAGWAIQAEASRLRVSSTPPDGFATLADLEAGLRAHYAAPRRVYIDAGAAGRDALAVSALVAQGLALRMGEAPILVTDPRVAELVILAEVRASGGLPAIDMTSPTHVRLSAGDPGALIASARLFAARSMNLHTVRFELADALCAWNAPPHRCAIARSWARWPRAARPSGLTRADAQRWSSPQPPPKTAPPRWPWYRAQRSPRARPGSTPGMATRWRMRRSVMI